MKLVNEYVIDQVTREFSVTDGALEAAIDEVKEKNGVLLSYFFSDNFSLYTQEEKEFSFFLFVVICKAIEKVKGDCPVVTEEQLGEAEERNWGLLETVKSHNFRERLDVFFADSPQEDLLAFIEDALTDDEESPVTKAGREGIFVALKSVVDCLTGS